MEHNLFKERSFRQACESVVGDCNGVLFEERWLKETPDFAAAILRLVPQSGARILDYGCGVGRLAKEILSQREDVTVVGVDASAVQLRHAQEFVDNARFSACFPHELEGQFNLVYSVYVLQHVPAIELREAISRIHYRLRPDGVFVHCSSDTRMSVRWDEKSFFDDRFLGVNVFAEVDKLFMVKEDLFDKETLDRNEVLRKMILGFDGRTRPTVEGLYGLAHPATVHTPRAIAQPYFDLKPLR
jgi:SAM-dependent methyltransferase